MSKEVTDFARKRTLNPEIEILKDKLKNQNSDIFLTSRPILPTIYVEKFLLVQWGAQQRNSRDCSLCKSSFLSHCGCEGHPLQQH